MKGYDIHISFAEDEPLSAEVLRVIEGEEVLALLVRRSVVRVEVFRLAVVHDAPAEGYDRARRVDYREHHAVAEDRVGSVRPLTDSLEISRAKLLVGVSLLSHIVEHRKGTVGRKSEPEAADYRR